MSQHDIEDMVEDAVRVLDRHAAADDVRVRDALVALYRFQRQYDCGHTMGRVEDVLLRRGHTYRFPLADFPEHARIDEFTELDDGYADPPWLYCEAGDGLWRWMVAQGRLRGAAAVPPGRVRMLDVAAMVCEAAEKGGDAELVALWWAIGPGALMTTVLPVEDLADDPAVRRLRDVVRRTGAAAVPLPSGFRPSDDDLQAMDDDVETWWYRLD